MSIYIPGYVYVLVCIRVQRVLRLNCHCFGYDWYGSEVTYLGFFLCLCLCLCCLRLCLCCFRFRCFRCLRFRHTCRRHHTRIQKFRYIPLTVFFALRCWTKLWGFGIWCGLKRTGWKEIRRTEQTKRYRINRYQVGQGDRDYCLVARWYKTTVQGPEVTMTTFKLCNFTNTFVLLRLS